MDSDARAWSDRSVARAEVAARDGGAQRKPGRSIANWATPARTDNPPLAADASAADACAVLLRYYGEAIARNVRCVLEVDDLEGPHQLRVCLRRLRTALRVFRPAMRRSVNRRLVELARDVGGIAGALRDADVVIEEMIRPAHAPGVLLQPLDAWREEVRARVRAGLIGARADEFAGALIELSETRAWRPKRAEVGGGPAAALASAAMAAAWKRAARRGGRIGRLDAQGRHELRKDVKSFRYAYEIASALSKQPSPMIVPALKGLQASLGRLNDLAMLEQLQPPIPERSRQALDRVRARLAASQGDSARAALADAVSRWRWLAMRQRHLCTGRLQLSAIAD